MIEGIKDAPQPGGPWQEGAGGFWSLAIVYISNTCSVFIDLHVLALAGSSRAHHDVRHEKLVPTAPISSSFITI
jgi:hypothetical protein